MQTGIDQETATKIQATAIAADINGDGVADLFTGGPSGTWTVSNETYDVALTSSDNGVGLFVEFPDRTDGQGV